MTWRVGSWGHTEEAYDEAVSYPQKLEDVVTEYCETLNADYHDPNQGWSDPCPRSCPICKEGCLGRDSAKHESSWHGCGQHLWEVSGASQKIMVASEMQGDHIVWKSLELLQLTTISLAPGDSPRQTDSSCSTRNGGTPFAG